jgi:hypothetical protein
VHKFTSTIPATDDNAAIISSAVDALTANSSSQVSGPNQVTSSTSTEPAFVTAGPSVVSTSETQPSNNTDVQVTRTKPISTTPEPSSKPPAKECPGDLAFVLDLSSEITFDNDYIGNLTVKNVQACARACYTNPLCLSALYEVDSGMI